jgi:hypothetical protein
MTQEMIPADKGYRRLVLVVYGIIGLLGAVIIGLLLPKAQQYLQGFDLRTTLRVAKLATVVLFLSIIPLALYLLFLGRRVLKSDRFPPPGTKVIRDTKLMKGNEARVRGRLLIFLSIVLIALALFGALYVPHILNEVAFPKVQTTGSSEFEHRHYGS